MILAFLRAHWPLGVAALAGAVLCRLLMPKPEPRLEWHDLRHYEGDMSEFVQINRVEGPERIVTKKYALTCPPQGPETDFHRPNGLEDRLVEETTTERAPVTTETSTAKVEHQQEDRKLDLTVTPESKPRWALQAGFENVLHEKHLRLAGRLRLFGPLWAEVSVIPVQKSLGAAVAFEW